MNVREIKEKSRDALKSNWWIAMGALIIYGIVEPILTPPFPIIGNESVRFSISLMLGVFIMAPLYAGIEWLFLDIYDEKNVNLKQILDGFKLYGKVIGVSFLRGFFIFLWSFLLIVPGIIKSIAYSQTLYILRENPNLSINEAIKESERMMDGYKGSYFMINLQLCLWLFALIFPSGIAITTLFMGVGIVYSLILLVIALIASIVFFLYLIPLYSIILAGFYRELKNENNI